MTLLHRAEPSLPLPAADPGQDRIITAALASARRLMFVQRGLTITVRALTLILFGLLAYWGGDRSLPVRQVANEMSGSAAPGSYVELVSLLHRERSCRANVEFLIVDAGGVRYSLAPLSFSKAPGPLRVDDPVVTKVPVPAGAWPGLARFRMLIEWRCNPVHELWPVTYVYEGRFLIRGPP